LDAAGSEIFEEDVIDAVAVVGYEVRGRGGEGDA